MTFVDSFSAAYLLPISRASITRWYKFAPSKYPSCILSPPEVLKRKVRRPTCEDFRKQNYFFVRLDETFFKPAEIHKAYEKLGRVGRYVNVSFTRAVDCLDGRWWRRWRRQTISVASLWVEFSLTISLRIADSFLI